jgi:hypothetical protein
VIRCNSKLYIYNEQVDAARITRIGRIINHTDHIRVKVKVKQTRYRSGVAQRVPGS